MRKPAFSSAVRCGAPVGTTIHAWLNVRGGSAVATARSATITRARMNPKSEIHKLRGELERHNRLYYEATPEISDYDFDQMMRRLQQLEGEHPELADPNSPSQRVGGAPIEEFKTVVHAPPMLSIDNAYSLDELREWDARVKRGLGIESVEYEAELKLDGVST